MQRLDSSAIRYIGKSFSGFIRTVSLVYMVGLVVFFLAQLVLPDRWWVLFLTNFMPFYFLPAFVLLPLALVFRQREIALPLVILSLSGAALFGRGFLPHFSAAPSGLTLKVLTFNISHTNLRPDDVEAWLRRQKYDLALLQEITPDWTQVRLNRLREVYPYQMVQSGMAVLSRYPLSQKVTYPAQQAAFSKARLDINGKSITVYNVSLPTPLRAEPRQRLPYVVQPTITSFWDMSLSYDETDRNQAIEQLIHQLQMESSPIIIAGDFNMSDQSAMYAQMAQRMNDSFRQGGWGLGTSWPVFQVWGFPALVPPLVRLDYIWTSSDIRVIEARQGEFLGSDHLPLVAVLEFPV